MATVLVKNADRMMTSIEALDKGIKVTFADGKEGLIPFVEIPEFGEVGDLLRIDLPNPYELVLYTQTGDTIELPWDFARHFADVLYRPKIESIAQAGRQEIGTRIRQLREAGGLTQSSLAHAANIGRVTLVRIERGGQSPRYETLVSLARALGLSIGELLSAGVASDDAASA